MTTTTEVDGRPAEIHQEPALAALTLDEQIDNLVHDIRRTMIERNRRAVAAARSRERLGESEKLLKEQMQKLAELDEKRSHEQIALIARESTAEHFDEDDEDEEGDDEGNDGEED